MELHQEAERMMFGIDKARLAGDPIAQLTYTRAAAAFEWAAMLAVERTHPERVRTIAVLGESHDAFTRQAAMLEASMDGPSG